MPNTTAISEALVSIAKRAEAPDLDVIVQTFVNLGPLVPVLSSQDHQIIYGRRGTGKTHALRYVAGLASSRGDVVVYVDMRTIGSSGGLYGDPRLPLAERATRLLQDTLSEVHSALFGAVLECSDLDLSTTGPALDHFAAAITSVTVVGSSETEHSRSTVERTEHNRSSSLEASFTPPRIDARLTDSRSNSGATTQSDTVRHSGELRHRVHFGAAQQSLREAVRSLGGRKLLVILDEWSDVPLDLQPYLADMLRRSMFPVQGVSVKIGAIEQRSAFQLAQSGGDYIGIELGADAGADVNLDDFMVFDNDAPRATQFFEQLIFLHFVQRAPEGDVPRSSDELIRAAFTQRNAFEELVQAAEGVPRDAIQILSLAAQRAFGDRIAKDHVRAAAKAWYERDKERAVSSNAEAKDLLHHIVDEVIGERRARAFLLRSDARSPVIDALFDSRVLHIRKRNIASNDQPGVRYHVYKIDYGCYVDLLTTSRAPQGLLPSDAEGLAYVDVPPDDYRSIRRAILDLESLRQRVIPFAGSDDPRN